MVKHISICILIVVFFVACSGDERGKERADRNDHKAQFDSASKAVDFSVTDSVELIYFPDPAMQKNYRFRGSSDTAFINALIDNLNDSAFTATACTHYKKMYLFASGEVFKTIYVSDSCNYLAFAINGQQQFRILRPKMKSLIDREFREIE